MCVATLAPTEYGSSKSEGRDASAVFPDAVGLTRKRVYGI